MFIGREDVLRCKYRLSSLLPADGGQVSQAWASGAPQGLEEPGRNLPLNNPAFLAQSWGPGVDNGGEMESSGIQARLLLHAQCHCVRSVSLTPSSSSSNPRPTCPILVLLLGPGAGGAGARGPGNCCVGERGGSLGAPGRVSSSHHQNCRS